MSPTDNIERLLAGTPTPGVVAGPHRLRLERQLFSPRQAADARVPLLRWRPVLAWAACAALVFLVARVAVWGWVRGLSIERATPYQTVTLPDGGIVLSGDPDYSVTKAVKHYQEAEELMGQGKHELVRTIDLDEDGAVLVYQVILSNGQIAFCTRVVPPAGGGEKDAIWVRLARP